MKQKVLVKNHDHVIFKGSLLDLPIKEPYMIMRSIELFEDSDPCVIHRSYVNKKISEELLKVFNGKMEIVLKDIDVSFIDLPNLEECILYIGG